MQQIVHSVSIFLGDASDAPHYFAPGPELVFFRNRRTLSRLIPAMRGWFRAAAVSRATVQRPAPSGGAEHANAATWASSSVWYCLGLPGRGASWRANSSPPCKYAARVRQIAVRPTPSTAIIWLSGTFWSSAARMWARLISRAMCNPFARNTSSSFRSFLVKQSSVWRMIISSFNRSCAIITFRYLRVKVLGNLDVEDDEKYTETEYSYKTDESHWIQKIKKTWMTTEPGWDEDSRISEKQFFYDGNSTAGTITDNGLLTGVKELLTDTDPGTGPGGTFIT